MSSLRNAVKRITHKERSQPQARQHLGILEKHKDYTVRAKDYHRKEKRIKVMKEKASMRNPDEFYFGMKNAQVKDGKHQKTVQAKQREFDEQIGTETIRIMKDQDLAYIRMHKTRDLTKAEKLKASLHFVDDSDQNRKHTVFVESQQDADHFDVADHFDTLPELAGRTFNRPRKETLRQAALRASGYDEADDNNSGGNEHPPTKDELTRQASKTLKIAKKAAKERDAAYAELEARLKRARAMERAEAHLITEKLVAAKGRKRKIKDAENGQPAQYKWRRKRLS